MIAQHLNWHRFVQPYEPREDDFDPFFEADPAAPRLAPRESHPPQVDPDRLERTE